MHVTSLTQLRVTCVPTCHHILVNGRTTAILVVEALEKKSTWKGMPRHAADKTKCNAIINSLDIIISFSKYNKILCLNLIFYEIKSYFFTGVILFFYRYNVSFIII